MSVRVIVCGGRMWGWARFKDPQSEHVRAMGERNASYRVLDAIHRDCVITAIINGDARGADKMSSRWAGENGIPVTRFPANWKKHGRKAGPLRNQQMADEGDADLVVAFPGGIGTSDMVGRALNADLRVLDMNNEALAS